MKIGAAEASDQAVESAELLGAEGEPDKDVLNEDADLAQEDLPQEAVA
jgi:hypothetical protein